MKFGCFNTLLLLGAAFGSVLEAKEPSAEGVEFFEKKIRPVLVKHCYECHSAESKLVRGGLLLDTREGTRNGGDSGPAVVPGDLEESLLINAMRYEGLDMPPEGKLPDEVVADFEKWVKLGAPDPRDGKLVAKSAQTPVEELWSLKPVVKPKLPEVRQRELAPTEIDRFVVAQLEAHDLQSVGLAKPAALLRRLYFDLIGLPPQPAEVRSFMQQVESQGTQPAIAALVDELLASSHFGERWGRHWLDVARYAESNGKERDVLFPNAWRYRDYVIDSFNADKPFDRFVTEQLAGDFLPAETAEEQDELKIATGFLAIGPKSLTKRGIQFDLETADEQIDVTSRAFMGLTVSCARCHDHKFDPIPTKDYYGWVGIFRSTKTLYGRDFRNNAGNSGIEDNLLALGENAEELEQQHKELRKQIAAAQKKIGDLKKQQTKLQKNDKRNEKQEQQLKEIDKKLAEAQQQLKPLLEKKLPPLEYAMAVQEATKVINSPVHIRGEPNKTGDMVPRGMISTIPVSEAIQVDPKHSGRLELAEWITDPSNPLTARVFVNRVWHHLFGRGIVGTVDNFGTNGERPTHPELLDYLAHRFVEQGWSVKQLIRDIVLTRTYQLASDTIHENSAVDPENRWLWRATRRRLQVEPLRDAMLSVAGRLELEPLRASRIAEIGNGEVGRGINQKPLDREHLHRSVYLPILRTRVSEILRVFDFAEPSIVVGRRVNTVIPEQSLFFMNSPFVLKQSQAFAERLLQGDLSQEVSSQRERLAMANLVCFARPTSDAELDRGQNFLQALDESLAKEVQDAQQRQQLVWASYCQALFASSEFRYLP